MPKTTSTPAASSERTRLCAPVIGSPAADRRLGRLGRLARARRSAGRRPGRPDWGRRWPAGPGGAVGVTVVDRSGWAPLTRRPLVVGSADLRRLGDEKTPRSAKDSSRGRAPAACSAGALTNYEDDPARCHRPAAAPRVSTSRSTAVSTSGRPSDVPSDRLSRRPRPGAALPTSLAYFASTPRVCLGGGADQPVRRAASSASSTSRSSRRVRDVEPDPVAVADERDRAAVDRLRRDVADAQPGRAAGEPAVGEQQHVLAQPGALDRAGDGEHLAHARAALGPFVADHHDVAGLRACRPRPRPSRPARRRRPARCPRRRPRRSRRDFTTAPSGASEPCRMVRPPVRWIGLAHRPDDLAVGVGRRDVGEVLGHRPAGDGERVAVQQAGVEQRLA